MIEETKDKNGSGKNLNYNRTLKDWLILFCWISGVVFIGMLAVNQALEFKYRAEFLKSPCQLCLDLNPEVSKSCFIKEDRLYPDGFGGWKLENGTEYGGYVNAPSINISQFKNNN